MHRVHAYAYMHTCTQVRIDHAHAPMDVSDHWPIIATFTLTSPSPPPTSRGGLLSAVVGLAALVSIGCLMHRYLRAARKRSSATRSTVVVVGGGEVGLAMTTSASVSAWELNDAAAAAAAAASSSYELGDVARAKA